MDTTKDIVDEEENNNDVDVAAEQPNNNNNTSKTSATSSSRLQLIEDDNNDLPLPMGAAEEISNRAEPPKEQKISKVEVELIDVDNIGPEPPAMLEASLNAANPEINNKKTAILSDNLSSVNDDQSSPPTPFDSTEFEDTIAKKKDEIANQKDRDSVLPPSDRDSIYELPREVIEEEEGISDNTNTGRGGANRRGWDYIGIGSSSNNGRDIESQTNTDNNDSGGGVNNDSTTEANVQGLSSSNQEAGDTDIHIPVAWKVEEDDDDEDDDRSENEVYDATPVEPTLPWWKQRRAKVFFGVIIVLVGAFARSRNSVLGALEVLGFVSFTPIDEVKARYRYLAIQYHPDKHSLFGEDNGMTLEETTAHFRVIKEAWEFLREQARREA